MENVSILDTRRVLALLLLTGSDESLIRNFDNALVKKLSSAGATFLNYTDIEETSDTMALIVIHKIRCPEDVQHYLDVFLDFDLYRRAIELRKFDRLTINMACGLRNIAKALKA